MTTEEALRLADSSTEIFLELGRAKAQYESALARFQSHTAALRQAMIDLAQSLAQSGLEAALLTVVAIQHGDADEAYAYARAAVQCTRCVEATDAILFGANV